MDKNKPITGTNINNTTSLNITHVLPDATNKTGGDLTATVFGLNPSLVKEITNINHIYRSKHGLTASIPIICRGSECVYKDVCMVSVHNRTPGIRCPMEISAILSRYEQWCNHFDIDVSQDEIQEKDIVDATLIKDLVNVEIQMIRAENKIALNGDFMANVLLDIDKKCNPYFGKAVSPETEFLMGLQDKKIKLLNQLNSTRKDKANDKSKMAASDVAIRIFQQAQQLEKDKRMVNISDMDFTEVKDVEPEEMTNVDEEQRKDE